LVNSSRRRFACAFARATVAVVSFFAQTCAALAEQSPAPCFVCTHVSAALVHASSAFSFPANTFAPTCAMTF
jgi:hypothetical protein